MDPPRTPARRHGYARRCGRTRNRDRPPNHPQPHRQAEGRPEENRPSDGRAALEPRAAGAGGAGGLYERGQIDADEPHRQKRGLRRKQVVRHPRHDGAQGGVRQPAVPAFGYGGIHPQAADRADRIVQVDPRRGARGRPAGACGRHFASAVRGADSRGEADLAGDRRGRQAGLHGLQQNRRLHLY